MYVLLLGLKIHDEYNKETEKELPTTTFEQLKYDAFGNQVPAKTEKQELEEKAGAVQKQITRALEHERYEEADYLKHLLELIKKRWLKL